MTISCVNMKRLMFAVLSILLFINCSETSDNPRAKLSDLNQLKPKYSFSGRIVFQSDMDGDREIYVLTKKGLKKLTDNDWDDEYPKWSPDGEQIAFSANPKGNYDVFIMDKDGSNVRRITSAPKDEGEHAWFPDGKKISYTIKEKRGLRKRFALWEVDLDSLRKRKALPEYKGQSSLPNFSPTSPLLAFTGKKTIGWDVFLYDMDTRVLKVLTEGGKACRPHFSRDGMKIAYVSASADGKGDIWLMDPDGSNKLRLTARDDTSDYFPSWSSAQDYIVFSSSLEHRIDRGNWALFLVDVKTKEIIPLFDSPGRDVFPSWY